MKHYGIIYEYLPANNDLHKVNDGNMLKANNEEIGMTSLT